MADNTEFQDELLPPPPPKKSGKTPSNVAEEGLPLPPKKKYSYLYYWHKAINFLKTI